MLAPTVFIYFAVFLIIFRQTSKYFRFWQAALLLAIPDDILEIWKVLSYLNKGRLDSPVGDVMYVAPKEVGWIPLSVT